MAIYLGDKKVSGNARISSLPLFYHTPQDHLLNDPSWLRADTYSWHLAKVYIAAYAHLVKDINGKTAQTETVAGITITYYRADDDHKIILPDQILNADLIYNSTGIAWYFILDTTNQRFKLPRNKYAFTGFKGGINNKAGDYVAPTTATLTSGDSTVQPPAIQTYLYFYVGNTVQNESSINVGQLTEAINNKQDKLIAGNNITIVGNTISANETAVAQWGNIVGTLSNQTDLVNEFLTKADLNLSNLQSLGKQTVANLSSPSGNYQDITVGASGAYYTAPSDGYFTCYGTITTAPGMIAITAQDSGLTSYSFRTTTNAIGTFLPCRRSSTIIIYYSGLTPNIRFVHAQGSI